MLNLRFYANTLAVMPRPSLSDHLFSVALQFPTVIPSRSFLLIQKTICPHFHLQQCHDRDYSKMLLNSSESCLRIRVFLQLVNKDNTMCIRIYKYLMPHMSLKMNTRT